MDDKNDVESRAEARQLWKLLGVTYVAMLNAKKRVILEPLGINLSRAWALWGLKAMDRPATITEMSQILDRDRQATAQLLKRMEDGGLVKRDKKGNEKNAISVSLTAEGEKVLGRIMAADEVSGEIMMCLSAEERAVLKGYLQRLHMEALARVALHSQYFPDTYAAKLGIIDKKRK